MRKGYLEDVIRDVRYGDAYQCHLGDVNEKSYRAKVSQINKKDGYKHYSVAVNKALGIFCIINNGDKKR